MSKKHRRQVENVNQQREMIFRSNGRHGSNGSELVYECMDRRCSRYMVAVIPEGSEVINGARCSMCQGWLRIAKHRIDGWDAPPLIEGVEERVMTDADGRERVLPITGQPRSYNAAADDTFSCTPDVQGCPIAGEHHNVVNVPITMWDRWIFLANKMDTEWIAYLKGEIVEAPDGMLTTYNITELYFPKQTMAAATCEAEPGEVLEGTIGSVHSHVGMKAFFSSVDEAHFNHAVEMVINRAGEVDCRVRVKLECGRYQRVVAKVLLSECGDRLEMLKELQEKRVESKHHNWQPIQQGGSLPTRQEIVERIHALQGGAKPPQDGLTEAEREAKLEAIREDTIMRRIGGYYGEM